MSGVENLRTIDADRRRRPRLLLTWTIYLTSSSDPHRIEGRTKDLSSDGFYCFAPERFAVGTDVSYNLVVPGGVAAVQKNLIVLEGHAEVVRVEPAAAGVYGIACRVRDYKVLPANPRSQPEQASDSDGCTT
jgi:hypothetical protein